MASFGRANETLGTPVRFAQADVEARIRKHHPGCPAHAVKQIAKRVGARDWFGTSMAVGISINAYLHHEKTPYEKRLRQGLARVGAIHEALPKFKRTVRKWALSPEQATA